MKCSVIVLCFALAAANGQLMGSLYDWVGSTSNLMSAGVSTGAGVVQGMAGMKQGAVNSAMNVGRGGVNVAADVAGTMVDKNIKGMQELLDRNAPSVIARPVSGLLGMVNSLEQAKISGMSAAARMPMNMIDRMVGLEAGAIAKIADAMSSAIQLNIRMGAGVAKSMIQLVQGVSSMSGQMGRVMPMLMRNMPAKMMNLAVQLNKLDMLPAMKHLVDDLKNAAQDIYNNVKSKFDETLAKLTGPEAQARLAELKSAFQDMVEGGAGAIDKMVKIAEEMGLPTSQEAHLRTLLENMSSAFSEVKELREAVTKGMEHVHEVVQNISSTVNSEEFKELTEQMREFMPKLMEGNADIEGFVQKIVTAMPDLESRRDDMINALKSFEESAQNVKARAKEAMEKLDHFINLPALGDMIKQLKQNIEDVIKSMPGMDGIMGNAAGIAGNAAAMGGNAAAIAGNAAAMAGNAAAMAGNAAGIAGNVAGMGINAAGMGLNAAGAVGGAASKAIGGASSFIGGRLFG